MAAVRLAAGDEQVLACTRQRHVQQIGILGALLRLLLCQQGVRGRIRVSAPAGQREQFGPCAVACLPEQYRVGVPAARRRGGVGEEYHGRLQALGAVDGEQSHAVPAVVVRRAFIGLVLVEPRSRLSCSRKRGRLG